MYWRKMSGEFLFELIEKAQWSFERNIRLKEDNKAWSLNTGKILWEENLTSIFSHFSSEKNSLGMFRQTIKKMKNILIDLVHRYVGEVSTRFDNSCADSLHDLCYRSSRLCWMPNLILHRMVLFSLGVIRQKNEVSQ